MKDLKCMFKPEHVQKKQLIMKNFTLLIRYSSLLVISLFSNFAFANANFPDLKLAGLGIASTITAGTQTSYSLDLINQGTIDAGGPIEFSIYLSEDTQWSETDLLVDSYPINSLSFGASSLIGDLTISDLKGGTYFLIFQIDSKEAVIESNETNNHLFFQVEIIEQTGTAPCSFIKSFPNSFYADASPTIVENTNGYDIQIPLNSFNSSNFRNGILSTDVYGNLISFDTVMTSKPLEPNLNFIYNYGNSELYFQNITENGDTIFDVEIPINGNHQAAGFIDSFTKAIPFKDGYLIFGSYEYQVGTNGRSYEVFVITTDDMGNVLTEDYEDNIHGYHSVNEYIFGADGSLYLWTEHWADFDHLFKIDPNGNFEFHTGAVAGSTGSWLQELRLSPNGDYLWGRIGSNFWDKLLRVNTQTGETAEVNPWNILSPNGPEGDDFFAGLSFDKNGNVLIAQHFYGYANDPFIGFEFGLITPEFELVWDHQIEQTGSFPRIYSLGEVSNGYMFLASKPNNEGGLLIKVDADGQLTEACEDDNISSGPLGCDLNYTFVNNQLILGGEGLDAAHVKVKVFDGSYNFLSLCLDCGNTIDLPNFNEGALIIDILLMDEGWNPLCESFETIEVQNSGCTDNDEDGVCEEQDCDDNNPQVPATSGSACNDGNPDTQNDIIQADGCTCVGDPISTECNFDVTTSNGKISISGLTAADRAKIFTDNFDTFWKCNPWGDNPCSNQESISGLTIGSTYYVSIKSANGDCEEWIEVTVIGEPNNDLPDLSASNVMLLGTTNLEVGEILNFEFDAANNGTATAGDFKIKSYISSNQDLDANDVQDGTIPTGNWIAGYAVSDLTGALTIPNLSPGEYYLLVYLDADEEVNEVNENNNIVSSTLTFTILGEEVNCASSLDGFTFMGTHNNHNYFLSDATTTWLDANATADNIPSGYLATINDAEENEFIRSYLETFNEKVFIGYRDLNGDGNYEWENGAAVTYTNPAGNLNEPYIHIQYWDGKWSSDGDFKFRNFIIEIPCNENESAVQNTIQAPIAQDLINIDKLFPNPVSDQLNLLISSKSDVVTEINCYDQLGKTWYQGTHNFNKGVNQIRLDINDLPEGVFLLELRNKNGLRKTKRFVKL